LQEQLPEMSAFCPGVQFCVVTAATVCAVSENCCGRKSSCEPLKGYGLRDGVRISVGTMEQ